MDWTEDDRRDLEYCCHCALQKFVGRTITPELKREVAAEITRIQWHWLAERLPVIADNCQ